MTPIQEMIEQAKREGFTVHAPKTLTTYFYFSKDDKIGYYQHGRATGPTFSTVHKPCKHAGTGYKADTMAAAIEHRPHWASNEPINKYKSTDDFLASHWQPLTQQ
jgi:hypothetical protein